MEHESIDTTMEKVAKALSRKFGLNIYSTGAPTHFDGRDIYVQHIPRGIKITQEDIDQFENVVHYYIGIAKYSNQKDIKEKAKTFISKLSRKNALIANRLIMLVEGIRCQNLLEKEYVGLRQHNQRCFVKYEIKEIPNAELYNSIIFKVITYMRVAVLQKRWEYDFGLKKFLKKSPTKPLLDKIEEEIDEIAKCTEISEVFDIVKKLMDKFWSTTSKDKEEKDYDDSEDDNDEDYNEEDDNDEDYNEDDNEDDDLDDKEKSIKNKKFKNPKKKKSKNPKKKKYDEDDEDDTDISFNPPEDDWNDSDEDDDWDDKDVEDEIEKMTKPKTAEDKFKEELKKTSDFEDKITSFEETISKMLHDKYASKIKRDTWNPFPEVFRYDTIEEIPKMEGWEERFNNNRAEVFKLCNVLRAKLGSRLKTLTEAYFLHDEMEGRVCNRSLWKAEVGSTKVFKRKIRDMEINTAIQIVLDCSGSTAYAKSGGKSVYENEQISALLLTEVLTMLNIPHEVLGYTTHAYNHKSVKEVMYLLKQMEYDENNHPFTRQMPIRTYVYKTFNEHFNEIKYRFGANLLLVSDALYENLDADSFIVAAKRLNERREERKIMLWLSDGLPSCGHLSHFDGDLCAKQLKIEVKHAEKCGIDCIGIGIGNSIVKDYFKNNINIDDVSELPAALLSILDKVLLNHKTKILNY